MEITEQLDDLKDFERSPELAGLPDQVIDDAIRFLQAHSELKDQVADLNPAALLKQSLAQASPHFQQLFQVYLLRRSVKDGTSQLLSNINNQIDQLHPLNHITSAEQLEERKKEYRSLISGSGNLELELLDHLKSDETSQKLLRIEEWKIFSTKDQGAIMYPLLGVLLAIGFCSSAHADQRIAMPAILTAYIAAVLAIYLPRKKFKNQKISALLEENLTEIPSQIESCYELALHILKLKKLQLQYSKSLNPKKVKQSALLGALAVQHSQKLQEYAADYQEVFETYACDNELAAQQKNAPINLENVDTHIAALDLSLSTRQELSRLRLSASSDDAKALEQTDEAEAAEEVDQARPLQRISK